MLLSFARKRWSRVSGEDDLDFFFFFFFYYFQLSFPHQLQPVSVCFGVGMELANECDFRQLN